MADQDDDFDDLFSFGAEATSTTAAVARNSSSSDFDLLTDLNTPAPAPAATPANDEFDDLFGTPPGTPITPKTTLPSPELTNVTQTMDDFHVHDAGTRDFLEWLDDDDRHKDSLKQSAGAGDITGEGDVDKVDDKEEDDFDFDQMLAEADVNVSSSLKSSQLTSSSLKGSLQSDGAGAAHQVGVLELNQPAPVDVMNDAAKATNAASSVNRSSASIDSTDNSNSATIDATSDRSPTAIEPLASAESRNSQLSTGTITPEPISKPYVSACIEEELAFDSWNDDDADDVPISASEIGDDGNPTAEAADGSAPANTSTLGSPVKATFTTLSEAIRSSISTIDDVRSLFQRETGRSNISHEVGVSLEDRPYLWTKVICGKVLGELDNSSIAESFREWIKKDEKSAKYSSEVCAVMIEQMIFETGNNSTGLDQDLLSVLAFHDKNASSMNIDPLIPPVVYAILQSGIPPAAASVVLSQIEPSAMPLLRLSQNERYLAVKNLHMDFYLLACYHLPLLVMHLDRQCPGWYWPKPLADEKAEREQRSETDTTEHPTVPTVEAKNQHAPESGAVVPLSWFITNFAGELGKSCLDHKLLLPLWDYLLTMGDCSRKFFLAIAMLDKHSDSLLMSRGDELRAELVKVLNFKANSFDEESFVGGGSSGQQRIADGESTEMVCEWLNLAQSLSESTPSSVINMLRSVDDRAISDALTARQAALDGKARAQQEAEEAAKKKEREERDAEEKKALTKARLVAYYREYNPEKVDTIDQIYNMFDGRFEVLNEKLKKKYGKGFLPDEPVKDQVSVQTRNFFESVNKSISETRKHVALSVAERRKKNAKPASTVNQAKSKVALEISPTEIIPHVCSTKGHNPITGERWATTPDNNLKFYLIDCRPESIAKEQGRFPTAVDMGPNKLQDPDELQQLTDMFESLRGAVHICVMGEGFSSFPALYDHPLTREEEKLLEDDISRTSNCCLFFLKKGFPFVSILRGGFAAAHAFLWRNGPDMGLPPSNVLVDYDPLISLFSQLETARQEQEEYKNAPAREKTARTLQKIIDSSMTRLTMEEQRLNSLATDFSRPENVDKVKQSVRSLSQKVSTAGISFGKTPPLFMSKKFASTKSPDSESTDPAASNENSDSTRMPSIASFKEKIALKRWQPESTASTKTEEASEGTGPIESDESKDVTPFESGSASEQDSGDDAMSDSLRTLSIDSSAKQEQETAVNKQFPSMSQFRLKMGFSANKVENAGDESKPTDDAGEKNELSSRFGFLQKQAAPLNQNSGEKAEQNAASDTLTQEANQVKKSFDFLKKLHVPTSATDEAAPTATDSIKADGTGPKNPFGFLKMSAASTSQSTEEKSNQDPSATAPDSVAAEVMKSKFASFSKFGSSLLQKKEAIKSDSPEQDANPPSSPVKATFDSFSKSLEAVKTKISEYEDPFNPKNYSRPDKTRFSVAKNDSKPATQPNNGTGSLLFMEGEPDDGLEDVIDFGTTTESDTTELSDPFELVSHGNAHQTDDPFSGLNAQPEGDPAQNLFGVFSSVNAEGLDVAEDKTES